MLAASTDSAIDRFGVHWKVDTKPANAHLALKKIAENVYNAWIPSLPFNATFLGNHAYDRMVPDLGPKTFRAVEQKVVAAARPLKTLDREALSFTDKVAYDVVQEFVADVRDTAAVQPYEFYLSHMGDENLHNELSYLGEGVHSISSKEDAYALNARYTRVPTMFAQLIDNLRSGKREGNMAAKLVVDLILGQLDEQLASLKDDASIQASAYTGSLRDSALPEVDKQAMLELLTSTLRNDVKPALEGYAKFLRKEYVGRDPKHQQPGLIGMRDGKKAYAFDIRWRTDAERSPEVIHQRGLDEVNRIESNLRLAAGTLLGKPVSSKQSLPALLDAVKALPAYKFESPEAAEKAMTDLVALAMVELPKLWGVKLTAADKNLVIEKSDSAPAASFLAGSSERKAKLMWNPSVAPAEMPSLVFHELTHHLQAVVAQKVKGLPALVQANRSTGTVEGEALFTEALVGEHGLYEKATEVLASAGGNSATLPLVMFGTYNSEMLRAVRLVVDTGIHAMGWSRADAIKYMSAHLALPKARIASEVDRYIGMPGQALAYKIGQLEVSDLRSEAQAALGRKFRESEFLAALLKGGGAPLPVIRTIGEEFVRAKNAA